MNWRWFLVKKWLIRGLLQFRGVLGVRETESNGKSLFSFVSPETVL